MSRSNIVPNLSFRSPHGLLKFFTSELPSVLWRCWLGVRKGIRPSKNWVVGCWHGYLSGLWSEVQTCIWPNWCHCHSLSLATVKSRLVLPFWYRLTRDTVQFSVDALPNLDPGRTVYFARYRDDLLFLCSLYSFFFYTQFFWLAIVDILWTSFSRWQRRCDLSLSLLQRLVGFDVVAAAAAANMRPTWWVK